MRIVVTGGRGFWDQDFANKALDRLHKKKGITALIHGCAAGADTICLNWAEANRIPVEPYLADWEHYGKAAGVKRNQEMIDKGKPDGAIAFPGGKGTNDMVQRCERAGIKVWDLRSGDLK